MVSGRFLAWQNWVLPAMVVRAPHECLGTTPHPVLVGISLSQLRQRKDDAIGLDAQLRRSMGLRKGHVEGPHLPGTLTQNVVLANEYQNKYWI